MNSSFRNLAEAGKRLAGQGECVDCLKPSKSFIRCFNCNKAFKQRQNEKQQREEEYRKKNKICMIKSATLCKDNGGKCGAIICPSCSPMDVYDDVLEAFVPQTLEYLLENNN